MAENSTAAASGVRSGWPRRYGVVGLCFCAAFICYIDRVNISVAIIAMQEQFGWSETLKGFVLSSFFIGYMIGQVPSGWLGTRYGGKRVLGAAVVWWSLFTILTPLAALLSLPLLIATRIAMGLGEAAMFPGTYTLFSRWVPTAERSRAVALIVSGIPLGTLFALTTTGWLVTQHGWSSVFYLFGSFGILWALVWYTRVHEDPQQHPRISPAERELLAQNDLVVGSTVVVPWERIFRTPAVWALIVNHFCSNWTLYLLLAWLPSYFRTAQGLSITGAGLFSAAPWLTMLVMTNIAGWVADALVKRGASLTFVRKLMQVVGLLGSAAFLYLARDATSAATALALMCGALGALACTWAGYAPNHLDIAPKYAGVLLGITNTAGTIPGIVGVAITGWLVEATGTYATAFALAASVSVVGAAIWLMFGTARRVLE